MTINNKGVLPAIGLGMVAGAALGMMARPKQDLKHTAEKAMKTVSGAVESFSNAMRQ